ncbi:MAG TPA: ABC transporter permease subunit [Stellaceae bacterium]|nr:ABC transporter permease subunit [Stellaceae bacterium]
MAQTAERFFAHDAPRRTAPWRSERVRSVVFQLAIVAIVVAIFAFFASNAAENVHRQGIASGFGFLQREAAFEIGNKVVPFNPANSYGWALLVGFVNTLTVSAVGIVFATLLGFVVGLARLSTNWLVSRLALSYVEAFRNTPLILQLFVWWDVLRISAPPDREAWQPLPGVFISLRGVTFPAPIYHPIYLWVAIAALLGLIAAIALGAWARRHRERTGRGLPSIWIGLGLVVIPPVIVFLAGGAPLSFDVPQLLRFGFRGGESVTPEFAALVFGLVVFAAAYIGEIVRSGIQAVSRGQIEASRALGLSRGQMLRLIVIPQAIRIIVPPLTSEYLNLIKNSSLAVAIGFTDFLSVGNTIMNQTGQVLEGFTLIAVGYLLINIPTSQLMNLYNRYMALVER